MPAIWRARPGLRTAGLAVLCGLMLASGQAPLGWWGLAFAGLAGLIWRLAQARTAADAAWIGWMAGSAYFAAALIWIVEPFLVDPLRHAWMAPFAVLFLSGGLALFWAAAAAAAAGMFPTPGAMRPLALAGTLAAAELVRGYVLTGFPWALIGHIWVDTPLAQVVALIGPSGLTLITTLAAGLLVAGVVPWCAPAQSGRLAGLGLAAMGLAILASGAGFGMWRLSAPAPAAPGAVIRLVQPNAEQHLKWDADRARVYFDRQLAFTRARPLPDLTVWPETAVPYLLDQNPDVALAIAQAGGGRPVAVGIQRVEGTRGWNSLAVIGADGRISAVYDKHHLVPFGEYIPFGDLAYDLAGLRAFAGQFGNGYSAGPGPATLDLGPGLGRVLPLICYEAVFPQDLRAVPERSDWILQITNDAWFGTLTGPYQHLAQARLRAIEQGLPLARAANTGVSAMIDARGQVIASLALGTQGYLDVTLPGSLPATPYSRFGEGAVLLMLAALAGALVLARQRRVA